MLDKNYSVSILLDDSQGKHFWNKLKDFEELKDIGVNNQENSSSETPNKKQNFPDVKSENPAHHCLTCNKYLGFRGFCSQECHDKHYDNIDTSPEQDAPDK